MSMKRPSRRVDGEPAGLANDSGSASPAAGGLDEDGSRTMATTALFNPPIPAPEPQHYHFPGRATRQDL